MTNNKNKDLTAGIILACVGLSLVLLLLIGIINDIDKGRSGIPNEA